MKLSAHFLFGNVIIPTAAALVLVASMFSITACPPGSPPVGPIIDVATCVLDVVSKDLLAGMSIDVAIADAAVKCFGTASAANITQARTLWSAHLAAEARERADGGK